MDNEEKKFLKNEELHKVENYQEKLNSHILKEEIERRKIENIELTIRNHLLIVQNLKSEIAERRNDINTIRSKARILTEERDTFVKGLCKIYDVDPSKFGYDDVTGEIFEYNEDMSNESEKKEANKE